MKKYKAILVVGLVVMFMPLSGFTRDVKNVTLYLCGMALVAISLIEIRKKYKEDKKNFKKNDIFEESKPTNYITEEQKQ